MSLFKKLILAFVIFIFPFMSFIMVYRVINDKPAFISLTYLLDYVEQYDGFEHLQNVIAELENGAENLIDIAKDTPDFEENMSIWDGTLEVLKYIGNIIVYIGKFLFVILTTIPDLIMFLVDSLMFVLDFLPYILNAS